MNCMYAKFFGLRELPFNNTPDPRFFYSTPDHEEALASLIYAVQERKGFVLLTGEVGAGKTLVSRMMLRQFGTHITFANIHHAVQGAADLVESLCTELELPIETGASHSKCVRALHDFLLTQFGKDIPVVLVLDEAQVLPAEAFEQLRMIGNLEADDAKLLQVAILGQPELRRRFASPAFRQLRQRIFRVFHLPALSRKVTEDYIRHRLAVAGASDLEVFNAAAMDVIYECSQGLPRLINTVCDNAMLSAYSADRHRIDGSFVGAIIKQMMSLGEGEAVVELGRRGADPVHPPLSTGGPMPETTDQGRMASPGFSQEVIGALASRIAELESRLGKSLVTVVANEEAASPVADSRTTGRIPAAIDRMDQELSSKVEKLQGWVADLDRSAAQVAASVAEARDVRAMLDPTIRDARAVVAGLESKSRLMSQQEAHVHRAAAKVKAVVQETRSMFDGLKRASARTQRIARRAQKTHHRLVIQTELSRELAQDLARIADHAATGNHITSVSPSVFQPSATPGAGACMVNWPAVANPDRLRQILHECRERLADLRILVRSPNVHRAADPLLAHGRVGFSTGTHSATPTARLTRRVESLLDILESGKITWPPRRARTPVTTV